MKKDHRLRESLYNEYLRRIKKWAFCPDCHHKMNLDSGLEKWICDHCGYEISSDLYDSDSQFWYCEKCGSLLNRQESFLAETQRHKCEKCGNINYIGSLNARRICRKCGIAIHTREGYYCKVCSEQREKRNRTIRSSVAVLLSGIGVYYLSDNIKNNVSLRDLSDEELSQIRSDLQQKYRYAKDLKEADKLFWDMAKIDDIMSERAWGGETPRGPGYHREHGFNLLKDD